VLVDPYRRDGGSVTVTGWVALACMISLILVSVGGGVVLYRRLTGVDRPHTQYVKSGDA
jgi:Golgi apparatus protein 1